MRYLKSCITMFFCLLFILTWYFFVYSYISNSVNFYKAEVSRLLRAKSQSVKLLQECPVIEKQINAMDKNINLHIDKFSNPYSTIDKITDIMFRNNLDIKEHMPVKLVKLKSCLFKKQTFKFVIEGYFLDIYRFFKFLSKIDCFFELSMCTLKRSNQKIKCELILGFIVLH